MAEAREEKEKKIERVGRLRVDSSHCDRTCGRCCATGRRINDTFHTHFRSLSILIDYGPRTSSSAIS